MSSTPRTTTADPADLSKRVLVLAPVDGDARAVSQVLAQGGFEGRVCADIAEVAAQITGGKIADAGAVIIAQEAFIPGAPEEHRGLIQALAAQPDWSDLPLILLAAGSAGEDGAWAIARTLDPIGNITILERPLRPTTLLNAVAVALRARARQYELRATLREIAQHREQLEELVARRTAELTDSIANLHAAERLASLGTLATGLGHDIANLTLPIRARLDLLRMTSPSDEARAEIDAIAVAITHLSQLSAGMRLLGMDPERVSASSYAADLSAWAAELEPMLRTALPRHVRLECRMPPGLGVGIARHRLAQAVFNLVQNAGEALAARSEGEVRISAEAAADHAGSPLVRLRITDDGPGMTPEVLARCFEPYFSTKGRAIATGMGLGMVKGIIEAAGGTVAVESAPGRGTSFTINLPAANPTPHARERTHAHTGAVSVTDDRLASLACMFMEQLEIKWVRHRGEEIPSALLWVVDNPDAARIAQYLGHDPQRRAVVLTGPDDHDAAQLTGSCPAPPGRIIVLPKAPTSRALRDAFARARPAGESATAHAPAINQPPARTSGDATRSTSTSTRPGR